VGGVNRRENLQKQKNKTGLPLHHFQFIHSLSIISSNYLPPFIHIIKLPFSLLSQSNLLIMPNTESQDDSIATLQAMRRQEENGYRCNAQTYAYQHSSQSQSQRFLHGAAHGPDAVDESCRTRMVDWCYQVVDFCKFNRETVAIAVNYLDRYAHTSPELMKDRKAYQLASMTCLYTAIKIHEPHAMEPSAVSSLSRGVFSAEEVMDMERKILAGLQWRMNPPTALAFVNKYLSLMPAGMFTKSEVGGIIELSTFQTELAVNDPWFLGSNASTVALAAFANALNFSSLPSTYIQSFANQLIQLAEIHCNEIDLLDIEDRLFNGLETSSSSSWSSSARMSLKTACKQQSRRSSGVLLGSPRSVSKAHA
jgi:hypothetical protein